MQHMHIAINSLVGRKAEVKYTPVYYIILAKSKLIFKNHKIGITIKLNEQKVLKLINKETYDSYNKNLI